MQTITINHLHLTTVVNAALQSADGTKWHSRIADAYKWLMIQRTVTFNDNGEMLVPSTSQPNVLYTVGKGICGCTAFKRGIPCQHRASRQIICRLMVVQDETRVVSHNAAISSGLIEAF